MSPCDHDPAGSFRHGSDVTRSDGAVGMRAPGSGADRRLRVRSSAVQPSVLRAGVEPEPLPVPMPRARPATRGLRPAGASPPTVDVRHVGPFVHTFCAACGWRGPGRRASSSAFRDWRSHLADEHRADEHRLDEHRDASEREAEVGR